MRANHPIGRVLLLATILILCAVGGALSIGLLHAHVSPDRALLMKLCPANAERGAGCAAALDTHWARLSIPLPSLGPGLAFAVRRANVPVAFLGAAYFACLGVWFVLVGVRRRLGGWAGVPRLAAGMGGVASLTFVGIMAFTSAPWCLWCLAVHAVNAALVPAVWIATRQTETAGDAARTGLDRPLTLTPREALGALLVASIAVAGMWGYWRQARVHRHQLHDLRGRAAMLDDLRSDHDFLLRAFAAQPVVMASPVPLRPSEAALDDRPVMLVFTDFECPACRCQAGDLRTRVSGSSAGGIRILVRHFPLCSACNSAVHDIHPNACDAAYAAEAARLQGGEEAFRQMHDALFASADTLGPQTYTELASTLGLDAERLLRDMRAPAVRDLVAADIALGVALDVQGTPTVLLDGRAVPEICDTAEFYAAYAAPVETPALARPEPVINPVGETP